MGHSLTTCTSRNSESSSDSSSDGSSDCLSDSSASSSLAAIGPRAASNGRQSLSCRSLPWQLFHPSKAHLLGGLCAAPNTRPNTCQQSSVRIAIRQLHYLNVVHMVVMRPKCCYNAARRAVCCAGVLCSVRGYGPASSGGLASGCLPPAWPPAALRHGGETRRRRVVSKVVSGTVMIQRTAL